MRRLLVALLALAALAGLYISPALAQAQADPFDKPVRQTPKGEPVYADTNKDGKIRPDKGRSKGVAGAMYVTGADEVVLLDPKSLTSGTSGTQALAADCVTKHGYAASEASWWSPSNIKYTFRWAFAIDYKNFGCIGQNVEQNRYSAGLYATRAGAATSAYFRNDGAAWIQLNETYPDGCHCVVNDAYRNWGWSGHELDGAITYLGTYHGPIQQQWFYSFSATLQAIFTAPSPDHTTQVYSGCSQINGGQGQVLSGYTAC
jgi:hypothetical protein